jgi:hypothetical protein
MCCHSGKPTAFKTRSFFFRLKQLGCSTNTFQAAQWAGLPEAERARIKQEYNAAGIKIMVSLFGAVNKPTSEGADPVATANSVAEWVKTFGVDGVDVDYEDEAVINSGDGRAEAWIIALTKTLREQLPAGQYLITHARKSTTSLRYVTSVMLIGLETSPCSVVLSGQIRYADFAPLYAYLDPRRWWRLPQSAC